MGTKCRLLGFWFKSAFSLSLLFFLKLVHHPMFCLGPSLSGTSSLPRLSLSYFSSKLFYFLGLVKADLDLNPGDSLTSFVIVNKLFYHSVPPFFSYMGIIIQYLLHRIVVRIKWACVCVCKKCYIYSFMYIYNTYVHICIIHIMYFILEQCKKLYFTS